MTRVAAVGDRVVMAMQNSRTGTVTRSRVAGKVARVDSGGRYYIVWDTAPLKAINGRGQRIELGPYRAEDLEVVT